MDAVKNFGVVTLSAGYDAAATSILLSAGHGAKLPDPVVDGEYNLVWFDTANYTNPAEDPNVEIIRVTGPAGTGDTKTILRAQEGTVASNKNTAAATYTMVLGTTAKTITDIESEIAASDQNASEVPFTPTPGIGSNQVQGAIEELESDVDTKLAGKAATDRKLDDFGTPDDNTDLDSSITRHGLLPKLGGGSTNFLRADGSWSAPPGGGSGDMLKSVYDTDDSGIVDNAETVVDNAITNAKLANMAGQTIKGNQMIGSEDPVDLTPAQVRSLINVEDGAAADQTGAEIKTTYEAEPNAYTDTKDTKLAGIETGAKDDQIASEVPFTPTPGIGSTQVQGAIEELESDVDTKLAGKAATDRKLDDFGTPDDNTDLDSSITRHGLLPKLGGGSTNFLRADGSWSAPPGGGSGDMLKSVYDTDDSGIVDNAETVVDNAITNAKLANMAGQTIKGNQLIGSEDPVDLTPAQVRSLINVADGANAYTHPNHSGDVTSVGDGAQTIANGVVTNGKLANVGGQTIKGNSDIGTNPPWDLSASEVRSIINVDDGADVTGSNPPQTHDLSGALHNNTLLAALNAKITDATLIDTGDSRLSDSRDPNAHAPSHQNGGADQIRIDNFQEGEDNTDLDSSITRHGLLPKLGGGSTNYLRADGTWAAPGGGGSGTMTTVKEGGVQVGGADIVTLDFDADDFDITESPDTEINIAASSIMCRITSGTYSGDNTSNRAIPHGLGVEPKYVVIHSTSSRRWYNNYGDSLKYQYGSTSASYAVTDWTTTNFYVGESSSYTATANGSGVSYYWTAFG